MANLEEFAPLFSPPVWSDEAQWALKPFVTDLTAPIYSFKSTLPPQVLGALFSRASRAKGDLREVLWHEYLSPMLHPEEQTEENTRIAAELKEIIEFHHKHPNPPYNTQRAYQFFAKWLAQYGDDSIAQMTSSNLVAAALSQPALKFLEDQRIGMAPIEKSTRYVDYGVKVNGRYQYYIDPQLKEWGLEQEYVAAMDGLFDAYASQIPIMTERLQKRYPEEKVGVLEKKAFDALRGFLPMSTLSQVAFHGNAQSFKYMIDRCAKHPLGELRWFAHMARKALDQEIPSLLLRLDDDATKAYQTYLQERKIRLRSAAKEVLSSEDNEPPFTKSKVRLLEYDPEGENKVIAALLFDYSNPTVSWEMIFNKVKTWNNKQKKKTLDAHFQGRTARWQKVARAFENAFVRFEIIMNLGSYRDLHRHRMHTQARQYFTTRLGYETAPEIEEFGLVPLLKERMEAAHQVCGNIEEKDAAVAQYVPSLFHFVRFYQYQNLRQFFWEAELRTISQGRTDYRWVEQEKYRLLKTAYPLIMEYVLIDMNSYDLARRGTEEKIEKKEKELVERFKQSTL